MANAVKFLVRRDTSDGWANADPVLTLGEIGADMTLNRLKIGNGTQKWSELPWVGQDIYDITMIDGGEA